MGVSIWWPIELSPSYSFAAIQGVRLLARGWRKERVIFAVYNGYVHAFNHS